MGRAACEQCAQHVQLELQGDYIKLLIDKGTPRILTRPFRRALEKSFPSAEILEWDDKDEHREPVGYRMVSSDASRYTAWARRIGVPEEKISLPAWLTPAEITTQAAPDFFEEPTATELMPYQREGIRFGLARGGRVLLADDMGLGKTVQALGIVWQYRRDFPMLVIAPSSLRSVWEHQISRWTSLRPERVQALYDGKTELQEDAKVVIVSYALLARCERFRSFDGKAYKVVIADECHYIKNPEAQRSQALVQVGEAAERMVLISGTPVLNSAMELFPLLRLLDPKMVSQEDFARRYFASSTKDFGKLKYTDPQREGELHSYLFQKIGIRRKKEEVLTELPPKRRQTIFLKEGACKLSLETLKDLESRLFAGREDGDSLLRRKAEELRRASELVMRAKMRCCADYVKDLIESGIGKFLLFAHHRAMLDALEGILKDRLGGGYIRIDGATPQLERPDLVQRFQEDDQCHTALLSITALAEGQTLTAAEAVIFAELVWTPGTILQCEGRAHRIGQKGSVLIQYLLLDCETDRRCHASVDSKHSHALRVLDNESANFWEEEAFREEANATAVAGTRPKPFTAMQAHPKSRAGPALPALPALPAQPAQPAQPTPAQVAPPARTGAKRQSRQKRKLPTGEFYKVVAPLHLGLGLKINRAYSKGDLERRCKGDEQKLARLKFFIGEGKKLLLMTEEPAEKRAR